jgi:DNA polymerase III sliding clamp (beta) subunit (PCNA family)
VNIGDRQKGRIKPANVDNCQIEATQIEISIRTQIKLNRFPIENPYATGNAADKVAETIAKIKEPKKLLYKRFYEIRQH